MARPHLALRRRPLAALLAVLLTVVVLPLANPSTASASGWTDKQIERYFFCQINQVRAAHNLPRLQLDNRIVPPNTKHLAGTARAWANHLRANNLPLLHPTAAQFAADLIAVVGVGNLTSWRENLGTLLPTRHPSAVHNALMASGAHRANILRPELNRVGIGVSVRSNGEVVVVQRFLQSSRNMPAPQDLGHSGCTGFPSGAIGNVTVTTSSRPFWDVPQGVYFYNPVYWLYDRRVTTGCGSSDQYCPHDPVTRAQAITFLHRLAGKPAASGAQFADVPSNVYFSAPTRWGRAVGLTTGVGGSNRFEPHRGTSRAELITLLYRFAGSPAQAENHGFVDVPRGSYFSKAVAWAKKHGITTGVGGGNRFEPHRNVSRAEAAAFLVRYATKSAARGSGAIRIRV